MIKHLLLTACMAGAVTFAAGAQQATMHQVKTSKMNLEAPAKSAISMKQFDGRVLESKKLSKDVTLQKVQTATGMTVKRLVDNRRVKNTIKATDLKKATVKSEDTNDAITLNESFEGWDGVTEGWLPEGWTLESKGEPFESDYITTWFLDTNDYGFYPAFDGNYAAVVNYDENYKDEWLITPVIDLPEFPNLFYKVYVYPIFLFDLSYIDWDTYEFTEKHVAANLQVLVRAEGEEEWNVEKDYFEDYFDWTGEELLNYSPSEFENEQIDLSAYKGKRIQVAFRYYGIDGNSMVIESVRVSNPSLEAKYSMPFGTLFYGLDKGFSLLSLSMPVEPVNTPLTWYNMTDGVNIDFSWEYQAADNEILTTDDIDLTETYHPDYTSEFTCRNNCYSTPILTASAEGAAPGEFQLYSYFQTGGKAEWSIKGEIMNFGMSTFDANTEGLDIAVVDNDMESAIPVFGYSEDVDQFWTDYTFQGDEGEGDGVKLTGILNYYFAQDAPLVISGALVHAKGLIGENAEFTLEIIPLDEDGALTTPIATAKCKGSDLNMLEGGTKNFYSLPFTFEEPVVMSTAVCDNYIVRLSGFNDPENVEWFAPYQSVFDNPDGYALGWIEKAITYNGETQQSLSPIFYYTEGLQSFSISLDAAYPWLDTETNSVEISLDGVAEVALGSYYDGSELTATQSDGSELPEWLTVSTEGRYGNAKAVFTATGNTAANCNVKIAGPGVARVIKVSYDGTSAVEGINASSNAEVKAVYNAMGQRVAVDGDAKGLYMIRYSNGKVEKVVR